MKRIKVPIKRKRINHSVSAQLSDTTDDRKIVEELFWDVLSRRLLQAGYNQASADAWVNKGLNIPLFPNMEADLLRGMEIARSFGNDPIEKLEGFLNNIPLGELVRTGFCWEDTPQGHRFWDDLYTTITM